MDMQRILIAIDNWLNFNQAAFHRNLNNVL